MSSDQPTSTAHHGPLRDVVTWMALGLVVAGILVFTTHHRGAAASADRTTNTLSSSVLSHMNLSATKTPTTQPDSSGGAQLPRVSTTTTTSAATTSTTTTSATTTTIATKVVDLTTTGQLRYPSDISSTYLAPTSGGQMSARLTWRNGTILGLSLRCSDGSLHKTSSMGLIELVLATPETTCVATVTGAGVGSATAPFTLELRYPSRASGN